MKRAWASVGLACGWMSAIGSVAAQTAAAPAPAANVELPTIEVIQTTPLLGSGIDVNKVPASVNQVSASDIARTGSPNVEDALQQSVPSVMTSNQAGSPFQLDLEYRGFVASPVSGTPQGLAVYQNGVRINEAFGDIVNWDLIPSSAIANIDVVSNNPVFGLNALGGAVSVQMKDGFTYNGFETMIKGGSFGRIEGSLQYGKQVGNWATYLSIEALREDGWRDFSQSQILRGYGDIGYKGEQAEFHLNATLGNNKLGADGTTPIEELAQNFGSVYTTPQSSTNQLAFVNLEGNIKATDTFSIQSNLYFRHYNQSHEDGNATQTQACDPSVSTTFLCYGNTTTLATGTDGKPIPNFAPGSGLGEIDSTHVNTNSMGGTLQATDTDKLFGHDNHFVVGASYDHGETQFRGDSELGVLDPNSLIVGNSGYFLDESAIAGAAPVRVRATNDYVGAYAIDTFDVTSRLSFTAGGRFNFARIALLDELGGSATGTNQYMRFNPMVGATFKITPDVTAYGGYSEANRAPTPLELGCANPLDPCILQNFLVSDPPLKQVVSRTVEAGLRGNHDLPNDLGNVSWSVGVYRSENSNDILDIPDPYLTGFGYFQNVGSTRRQGIEAEVNYKSDKWLVYASYSLIDATFRSPITLGSNSPFADANGDIYVVPGDKLPAIPRDRFKVGFDYLVTDKWKLGADFIAASGQYLVGDESNQFPKLPGYGIVNLHSSYQLTQNLQVFGEIDNLFDRHYYTYGTFTSICAITSAKAPSNGVCAGEVGNFPTNAESLNPAAPFAVYAGVRATF